MKDTEMCLYIRVEQANRSGRRDCARATSQNELRLITTDSFN